MTHPLVLSNMTRAEWNYNWDINQATAKKWRTYDRREMGEVIVNCQYYDDIKKLFTDLGPDNTFDWLDDFFGSATISSMVVVGLERNLSYANTIVNTLMAFVEVYEDDLAFPIIDAILADSKQLEPKLWDYLIEGARDYLACEVEGE